MGKRRDLAKQPRKKGVFYAYFIGVSIVYKRSVFLDLVEYGKLKWQRYGVLDKGCKKDVWLDYGERENLLLFRGCAECGEIDANVDFGNDVSDGVYVHGEGFRFRSILFLAVACDGF